LSRSSTRAIRRSVVSWGFFWGQIPEELTPPKSIADAILREWLQTFAQRAGERQR